MSALAWRIRDLPVPLRSGRVLIGGGIVLAVTVVAIFAPWLAPYSPDAIDLVNEFAELIYMSSAEIDFVDPMPSLTEVGDIGALLRY